MNKSEHDKISSGPTPHLSEHYAPPSLRQPLSLKTSPFLSGPKNHFTCTKCREKFPTFDPDGPREKLCSLCKYDEEFAAQPLRNLNDSVSSANSAGLDTPNPRDPAESDGSIASSKKWVFDEDLSNKFLEMDLKEGRDREFSLDLSGYGLLADVVKSKMNYYDNRVMTQLERLSNQINSGSAPVTESMISSLRETVYAPGNALGEETCSICCDEYKADDHLLSLPCGHHFHRHCVTHWLYQKNCCPVCRSKTSQSK